MLDFTVYSELVRGLFLASYGDIAEDILLYCWANGMDTFAASEFIFTTAWAFRPAS